MISLILAVGNSGQIGQQGHLPWNCKADLRHFKETTLNKVVIMGRNTFNDIGNKPLPNRINVVISKTMSIQAGIFVFRDLVTALAFFKDQDIFIIGGPSLWNEALNKCLVDVVLLSNIDYNGEADLYYDLTPIMDNFLVAGKDSYSYKGESVNITKYKRK